MATALTTASTTQEQQVFEVLSRTRQDIAEYLTANPEANLSGLAITSSIDVPNSRATFTVTLPITISEEGDGGLSLDAAEVLV